MTTVADEARSAPDELTDLLLTTGEVAAIFRVSPSAVARWVDAGGLPCIRTPSGRRRFRASEIDALLLERTTRRGQ